MYALAASVVILAACQKSNQSTSDTSTASEIGVAASLTAMAAPNPDSVYLQHQCGDHQQRDSIARADLPASIGTYLDANYAGYTYHKAFAVKDTAGAVTGYVVVVYYNDKPVGLQFDSAGTFVRVLEQRRGKGKHH